MDGSPLRAITGQLDGESDITAWIGKVLATHEQDGSYGLVVGVAGPGGSVTPSAIFGFPNPADIRAQAPPVEVLAFEARHGRALL